MLPNVFPIYDMLKAESRSEASSNKSIEHSVQECGCVGFTLHSARSLHRFTRFPVGHVHSRLAALAVFDMNQVTSVITLLSTEADLTPQKKPGVHTRSKEHRY